VLLHEDYGVVTIAGVKDQKIPGGREWKLSATRSTHRAERRSLTGRGCRFPEQPSRGDRAERRDRKLPFGGAFRCRHGGQDEADEVSLRLEFAGPSGERCRSCPVKGAPPPKPHFVIKDKTTRSITRATFE